MLEALLKFRLLFCFFIGIRSLFLVVKEFNISEGNPEVSFPNKKVSIVDKNETNKISNKNRGMLLDRNNRILASNIYIYNL